MRNLKRALSLALASVMLLGMMVVGSSAKGIDDFTDKAEIVNQDAVAVTSAIGMFEGYEDGSFGPENVVTRAEMAVIICTMLYGAGVNVNQFAETNVFTDVPAWAQGYVNLCSSLGIVAGVGDGKFDPKANLTREQAAKLVAYLQLGKKSADALVGGNKFTDVAANRWSAGYVDYCATTGIVAGVGNGQFGPAGSLAALQFGKMLLVELGYDAKAEGMVGTDWAINTSKLMAKAKLMEDRRLRQSGPHP